VVSVSVRGALCARSREISCLPTRVGMLALCTRQFQHAAHRHVLIEPLSNLVVKDSHATCALACFGLLLHLLSQNTRNRIAMMAGEFSNLDIGPAFLLEASKWLTVPCNVASSLPPQYFDTVEHTSVMPYFKPERC
jgi:hypothetical protein